MKMRILLTVLMIGTFCLSYGQNNKVHASDSLYFIQVSASRTYVEPEIIQDQLNIIDSLGVLKVKSWYKYFVGAFESHQDAYNHMTARKIDGYVTQYFEGEIIVSLTKDEDPVEESDNLDTSVSINSIILSDTIVKEEQKKKLILKKDSVIIPIKSVEIEAAISESEEDSLDLQELSRPIDSVNTEVKILTESGVFLDKRDNADYEWVRIGDQVWMTRNLKFKTPFSINPVTDSSQEDSYGFLYDFRDAEQICPDGWKLPSDKDWMELESELGLENVEVRSIGHRSTGYVGISLKSKSDWVDDGNGMDNYGLNILPAGIASKKGDTKQQNRSSHLWSSSKSMFGIWIRYLKFDSPGILRGISNKNSFLSVRCIKDNLEQ